MVTDASSSKGVELLETDQAPGSGQWSFDFEQPRQIGYKHVRAAWLPTGLLALGVSAFSSGVDPWFGHEQVQRPAWSRSLASAPGLRRSISVREARRLSLEILSQAQAERLQLADEEAHKGLDVGEL